MAGIDTSDWNTMTWRIDRLEQRTDKLETHIERLEQGVTDLSREVALLHKSVEDQGKTVSIQLESVTHELSKFRRDFDLHGMEEFARFASAMKYITGLLLSFVLGMGVYIWQNMGVNP